MEGLVGAFETFGIVSWVVVAVVRRIDDYIDSVQWKIW
jgi:hypothetical protein